MKQTKRFITILLMVLACTATAWAQEDDDKLEEKARNWYADRIEGILLKFEGNRRDASILPQKYCLYKSDKAGSLGYAIAVMPYDMEEIFEFTPEGNNVVCAAVDGATLPKEPYWNEISDLGMYRTPKLDITLSERPMPVRQLSKAKNTFKVVIENNSKVEPTEYGQMIFKPHQNAVRLVSKHRDMQKDENGNVWKDNMEYVFALKNPAVMNKMFRGYDDMEAVPWVVKNSFFDNHLLLQYSRWKEGEPKSKISNDTKQIISRYYKNRPIKDIMWVASVESVERAFYAVQFEHQGADALAALVCVAEGDVVSSWEFHGNVDPTTYKEGESIWFVDDEGNFMPHAPEIHCIVATSEGLELYVRLFGGESVQYIILREIGTVLVALQNDTWVYVWD